MTQLQQSAECRGQFCWQQMRDGLLWPRDGLLPSSLTGASAGRLADDFGDIRDRLVTLQLRRALRGSST